MKTVAKPFFIIGPLPPPMGGVTMFVRRRVAQLRQEGHTPVVKDWNRMGLWQRMVWLLAILFNPKPINYEVNGTETLAMVALSLRPFPKTITYWVHSGRFMEDLSGLRRWAYTMFLKHVDECVLVSVQIYDMFDQFGFEVPAVNRVQYAFLPPPPEDEPAIWDTYDVEALDFIDQHYPLVLMHGGDAFYKGVDLYGTDLAVKAIKRLVDAYPTIGLLVGKPSPGNDAFQAYFEELLTWIEQHGLNDHVYFLQGEREFWPLMKRADLFLRPTNQDGDSVTVREAIHFGTPVIASDACPRPEVAILFTNRDAHDLAVKMDKVLQRSGDLLGPPSTQASRDAIRPPPPVRPAQPIRRATRPEPYP